jgi:hypothetical protein
MKATATAGEGRLDAWYAIHRTDADNTGKSTALITVVLMDNTVGTIAVLTALITEFAIGACRATTNSVSCVGEVVT